MTSHCFSRRSFLATSAAAAGVSFLPAAAWAGLPLPEASAPLDRNLDDYIAAYMPAMNAPGLTVGLTAADATRRVACYGYADLDRHIPVGPDHLFEIGSISKSFVALVILQLHEEGKLDLHKPVLDYLPDLPILTEFGPITSHHLLTHTSGLPDDSFVFASDASARLVQGFAPGQYFHYCNAAFCILGLLAVHLDGRPWRVLAQERILTPLGMTQTSPVLTTADRDRYAVGYQSFRTDLVYPRQGRLAPAPVLVSDETDGCIASIPGDMARYARMLLNRGQGSQGRIVSEASFALMSTPWIKAEDFSSTASYGYGIAVDTLDGHKILRHTGGMVAFASSIHVDLDGGVACFASINAMQGYRPTAVTEYAVRLLRAEREAKPLPPPPPIADARDIDKAQDYAGTFTSPDGRTLTFVAEGKRLSLIDGQKSIPLQHRGGDRFLSTDSGAFATYTMVFGRKTAPAGSAAKASQPVVEVSYGPDWYTAPAYDGPRAFTFPPSYDLYTGRYHSDSPWGGDAFVFVLKGRLFADGTLLTPLGNHVFRIGEVDWNPDVAAFFHIFQGKAQSLRAAGLDFFRVDVG
ncbi:MAG TPA: serine hydrolase domain-containing protein [Acidobacteriaceae bacterium]|nr:serine hydrolase domain-containing protein [Acidobacteriaceae bacterium]